MNELCNSRCCGQVGSCLLAPATTVFGDGKPAENSRRPVEMAGAELFEPPESRQLVATQKRYAKKLSIFQGSLSRCRSRVDSLLTPNINSATPPLKSSHFEHV
jgi:hypothetical protein